MMSILLAAALVLPGGSHSDVSYVRVLTPEARTDFYRSGGVKWLGSRVHLHVDGSLLRKKHGEYRTERGLCYDRYENRTVPLIVPPRDRLYREVLRRLDEVEVLCVKGRVVELEGQPGRCALEVDAMHRFPGKLESTQKKSDKKERKRSP